ncbi:MAG TPA: long-chain-acyl-CoA synthetase [Rhizomicrobium sp.]|nr:long-chain-acyl-CoA synthetase [Rhizomicrobium sp.]
MGLFAPLARESAFISSIGRTLFRMRHVKADSPITVTDLVERWGREKPDNIAVLHLDRIITYRDLNEGANRYARWAEGQGVKRGDAVALLMENRPEFLMAWLGIVKLGGIVALINTNQRMGPLAHSIAISGARHLVLGAELADAYAETLPLIEQKPIVWATGVVTPGTEDLDAALREVSSAPVDSAIRQGLLCRDKAFYIFTSGTTGLPKAANITHMRMMFMMYGFAGGLNAHENDRMYNVLPLYHTAGGVCALGPAFTTGGSVVLKRKFSTREFWDDCVRYKPTFFQYIGELCRYLLNAPPDPNERKHMLRAITGNGLRPEIWPAFQERFAIPKILEFYGATEGNVSMLNYDGHPGAVGRVPPYLRRLIPTRVVRFDIEREMPMRGPDGFCIECPPGEAGEAIGEISEDPRQAYDGYTRAADTEKKILRDVFTKGDVWFRTGDLLRRDELGYFYFVDRIGDTFRWKGENVATSEVSEALGVVPGVKEANVYGVSVPGMDGRAGMAALVTGPEFDLPNLGKTLAANLPVYARPVFLRLLPEMEITGTFKMRKVELVKEGFDPSAIADPLYVLDPAVNTYVPLDAARHADIVSGKVKL